MMLAAVKSVTVEKKVKTLPAGGVGGRLRCRYRFTKAGEYAVERTSADKDAPRGGRDMV